jgi:IgGFc binding protein
MRIGVWLGTAVACLAIATAATYGCSATHSTDDDETEPSGAGGSGGFHAEGGGGASGCIPGSTVCVGNEVHECGEDGGPGALVETCDAAAGLVCFGGACTEACDAAAGAPSNVGCEFWAVDLPNERGLNDAAADPWGVVLANAGEATAAVTIERNQAALGDPLDVVTVTTLMIPPGGLEKVELPRAEVTGWTPQTADPPGPPMTWVSSNAFRITSSAPLVVYQFNVFTNSYSNDASLLMPRNGLGKLYRVLGYPTANPISGGFQIAGIPDRSSVTVVGVTAGTNVTITASTNTIGDGMGIGALAPGDKVTVTLGAFDVLNLSSDGIPGDMTGTVVEASQPVAVFSSGERAIAPYNTDPPPPPDFDPGMLCCTDHIEEQLFPVTSLGKSFVVTRSPIRSDQGYVEPDELRFLGVAATAQVTTNLPAPFDSFTLQPGQMMETWTTTDVVVESSEPIVIGQILVSSTFTTTYIGDPSLSIFPPVEQYRAKYLFLVPESWTDNYFVLAREVGAAIELDGGALPSCVIAPAGTIGGVDYEAARCPVGEGTHLLEGDSPFGLVVYGYGNVGSYAFVGGADVEAIYEPPPIE